MTSLDVNAILSFVLKIKPENSIYECAVRTYLPSDSRQPVLGCSPQGSLQGSELGLPIRRLQKLNGISYREPTVSISIVTCLILGLVQSEV